MYIVNRTRYFHATARSSFGHRIENIGSSFQHWRLVYFFERFSTDEMVPTMPPDSHKISLKIIEAIKQHPVLYSAEVKGSSIKLQEFRQKVWKRISDELGLDRTNYFPFLTFSRIILARLLIYVTVFHLLAKRLPWCLYVISTITCAAISFRRSRFGEYCESSVWKWCSDIYLQERKQQRVITSKFTFTWLFNIVLGKSLLHHLKDLKEHI